MNPYHMSAPPPDSRAEAERWLAIAEKLLAGRDLVGSKTFAIRARESDPRLEAAEQILAVADTLIAADKRLNGQPDWYSVLQVPFLTADLDLIASHYRRLAILLNPNRGRLGFAEEAFQLVSNAWSVLSNPNHKSMYDSQVTFIPPPQPPPPQQNPNPAYNSEVIGVNSEAVNTSIDAVDDNHNNNADYNNNDTNNDTSNESELGQTFWTACPYCYTMYEYPSAYEECTMRCQNCRRAFHGAKVAAPPVDVGDTYLTWGFYPLGVSMSFMDTNKGGVASWTPFSPMFSCPVGGSAKRRGRPPGPAILIDDDDEEDDAFLDESDPSEDSDGEWGSTRPKRKKSSAKRGRGRPRKKPQEENVVSNLKGAAVDEVLQVEGEAQEGSAPKESVNLGKKPGKTLKELGKLDLNVEFSNQAEEPAPRVVREGGVARPAHGEEDGGIEGIGFFEGLDEFLSSMPILNVVGDDKVKAA